MTEKIAAKPVVPAQGAAVPPGLTELLDELKTIVRAARVRAALRVNTELVMLYWQLGRTILERQAAEKWGTKVVDRIAAELRTEFPGQRGFSRTNLKYMQQCARTWPEPIGQQVAGQLPWGHIQLLLDKCRDRFELDFYAQHAVHHGWSRDRLRSAIENCLHLREGAAANNFDVTLPGASAAAQEIVKDPYQLDFTGLGGEVAERELEEALVARLVPFLTELGVGFAFVGRQYPVRVGDSDYRIDLLFYHCRLHCYVVVELKTRKAEPEHIGKLGFYTAVVDDVLRDAEVDGPTIGILIAGSRDRAMVEYSLRGHNQPLAVSSWSGVPERVRALLPSAEDLTRVADAVLGTEPTS